MMQGNRTSFSQNVIPATKLLLIALILWANLAAISSVKPVEDGQHGVENVADTPYHVESSDEDSAWSLIDWNLYKQKFNKNYSSLSQQLLRQKIFMSKQIQVFLNWTKWRIHKNGYFTSINQFSDLTAEEEHQKLSGDGGEYPSDDEEGDDDDDDIMDDEQARRALLEALEEEHQTGHDVDSSGRSHGRHKRSLMSDLMGQHSEFQQLVRVPSSTDPSGAARADLKIKWVVPSNNPDYQPVIAQSLSAANEADSKYEVRDIPKEEIDEVVASSGSWLALPKLVGATAKSTLNWLRSNSIKRRNSKVEHSSSYKMSESDGSVSRVGAKKLTNDNVIVDWRKSGCVAPPMDQRHCQSCYAVSSMAFLEWALCMNQNRTLTPLSVQYFISCGPQYKQEADPALKIQFYGCERGRSRQAMYFVKDYGVELAAHMPYLARDTECPVDLNTPLKHKGYIRPNVKQHVRMAATTSQLELALKVGPVIVNFREPVDFLAYGGGMVGRCYQRGGHAMLIVGHGIDNGTPYLLIKNSFGPQWGIEGYFKFDRKYTNECIKDFILPRVSFPSKRAQARRVKAYLAGQLAASEKPSSADLSGIFDVGAGGLFSLS